MCAPHHLSCLGRVRIRPWGTSPCSWLSWTCQQSLCAFQLPPECGIAVLQFIPPSSLAPLLGALDVPAVTLGRGWLRWGKQKRDLAPAIPHAILGMRNLGRLYLTSPGGDRGEADWAAEGSNCMWLRKDLTEAVGRISPPVSLWAFETVSLLQCHVLPLKPCLVLY